MALDFPASPTTGDRVTLNSVIYEFDGDKWVTIRSLFDRGQFVAGTAAEPGFSVSTDANTGLYAPGADQLAFTTGGVERVEFGTSEVVFNDGGIDYDFRIEGDADVNLVFADASTDRIGIGTSTPGVKVDIEASEPYVTLKNTTEEDTDGGREVRIDFEGEQSGGEASTLARIEVSHDGAADDEKGKVVISTNDGADAAAPTTAVTIDSAQKVTIAGDLETNTINTLVYPDAGPLSNRNLIINGAMQVAQRGTTGTSQSNNNNFVLDRFIVEVGGAATVTHSQESSGAPAGFSYWLKVTPSVADTSIGSTDHALVNQHIEGYNFAHVGYGTADAQDVTVSFKFKTNKAGTYCMIHRNNLADRNYIHEFTPVADGSWQTITYTVPGDTTGTWETTDLKGWRFTLTLANGSSYQSSTTDAWFGGTYFHSTSNQVNFLDSTSNELGITGVQVEIGSKSTPFEHRSYGDELARCQRYFQRINAYTNNGRFATGGNGSLSSCWPTLYLPTTMRAQPSIDVSNASDFRVEAIASTGVSGATSITFDSASTYTVTVRAQSSGSATYTGGQLQADNTNAWLALIAEL